MQKLKVWLGKCWEKYGPTLTVLAVIAVVAVTAMNWGAIVYTGNQVVLVGQAAYRAYKWDRALDSLPDYKIWDAPEEIFTECYPIGIWGIKTNSTQLVRWTLEIVPYFEREGVTPTARYPALIAYLPGPEPRYHFNISGQANPWWGVAWLNYRYHNPASPWAEYNELATIVHELGHVQGVMARPIDVMEASNQVATIEVLAAMANDGNVYATHALLLDLRSFAMGYLRTELYEAKMGWLYRFYARRVIYSTFEEHARGDRGSRFWADNEEQREYIISAYQARPYRWAMAAIESKDKESRPLLLGPLGSYWRLKLDDLDYFLRHLDEHVREARRN